ncbi:hypothetical protein BU16DRAFT_596105 [Lophium mytilinum]|uniref:F-box domain-containing protein n=1 Tax=Lophium mytilinum TaxID=390894 RepID=A0A6A6QDI5_9PEZI|nr:hypothetical protein BU16DRAFT_596105 [Lophium mytilinum]
MPPTDPPPEGTDHGAMSPKLEKRPILTPKTRRRPEDPVDTLVELLGKFKLHRSPTAVPPQAENTPLELSPNVNVFTAGGVVRQPVVNGPTTSLNGLPPELIHQVCNYLDVPGLKNFRLTDSRSNEIAVCHLFSEGSFSASEISLRRLKALSSHTQYAKYVKKLEFVGTSDRGSFDWASMFRLGRNETPETLTAEDSYPLDVRADELGTLSDQLRLAMGPRFLLTLQKMPTLRSIKHCNGPLTLPWHRKSNDSIISLLFSCAFSQIKLEHLEIEMNKSDDIRGWGCLTDFRLRGSEGVMRVFRSLKLMALAHLTQFTYKSLRDGWKGFGFDGKMLGKLLIEMVSLEELEITFLPSGPEVTEWSMRFALQNVLGSIGRSNVTGLKSLTLSGMRMGVEHMFSFINKNIGTLQHLQLGKMVLEGGQWREALPRLRDWIHTSNIETLSIRGRRLEVNDYEQIWPKFDGNIGVEADMSVQSDIVDYLLNDGHDLRGEFLSLTFQVLMDDTGHFSTDWNTELDLGISPYFSVWDLRHPNPW